MFVIIQTTLIIAKIFEMTALSWIQVFIPLYIWLGIVFIAVTMIVIGTLLKGKCTCQQKLDTKLKKSGIKNESMYKIHQLF